ncbi:MAG TPA: hypothetical protein VGV37_03160 [Aliidongia sp.]|uniref:hypothetical protein n=1 Tax=Aliidongia sp. TaxID=1914230 RepID=UPI002DDCB5AA|nr:hypothetical protein [Aliidongia sp.]HEV2673513.1 hypothetical protein [Aliidongia sp.]
MSIAPAPLTDLRRGERTVEASVSAVSWAAVIAGAFVAAAVTLVLLALGSGFGLASISPWSNAGVSATTFTVLAGIWLIIVQWLSSAVGGYITGRLRIKWTGTHTHEVFFRDTAHGFLTWALATVMGAALIATAASSAVGTGVKASSTVAAAHGAADTGTAMGRAYDVDGLFRSVTPDATGTGPAAHLEATRILAMRAVNGDVAAADNAYLVQLVSVHTGLGQADAQKRVDDTIAQEKANEVKAKQIGDAARKSAAAFSIFAAISMLIGAFVACAAAAYGGQLRDEHP